MMTTVMTAMLMMKGLIHSGAHTTGMIHALQPAFGSTWVDELQVPDTATVRAAGTKTPAWNVTGLHNAHACVAMKQIPKAQQKL